jgi:hypothetical protein
VVICNSASLRWTLLAISSFSEETADVRTRNGVSARITSATAAQ